MAEETKVADNAEMKFTEEELQSLQTLQTNYQEKQAVLGQLAVQRILLTQQHEALETRIAAKRKAIKDAESSGRHTSS